MRERLWKTLGSRNSRRQFSRAILTSACFWPLVLRQDASSIAVLIFFNLTDELSFWMADLMGTEDAEGFCCHRKYECSAIIAVAKQ